MRKVYFLLLTFMALTFAACGPFAFDNPMHDGDEGGNGGGAVNPVVNNVIVPIYEDIDEFDEVWATPFGYFFYQDVLRAVTTRAEADDGDLGSLTWMSLDMTRKLTVLVSKSSTLPTEIVSDEGNYYFSYLSENVLELVYDNGGTMKKVATLTYDAEKVRKAATDAGYDKIKTFLSTLSILIGDTPLPTTDATEFKSIIESVISLDYDNSTEVKTKLPRDANGYSFVTSICEWFTIQVMRNAYYALSLWTGEATFKVGGFSCTLEGAIWCPVNTFNALGTYGIVCDTDKNKLKIGEAVYQETGYQASGSLSFGVDIRGLKPHTTYYYRSFYKFNSGNHGSILPKSVIQVGDVYYDSTIKSFTTGDNSLAADVVMCIDATGSMRELIANVKLHASQFFDLFQAKAAEMGVALTGLTAQVIGFRDKNVDTNWLPTSRTFILPEEKSDYNSYLNENIYAQGGGDTPESALEALQAAFNKSDWGTDDGYHRQIVILWTDAPYLIGSSYTDLTVDVLQEKWNTMPSGRRLIIFGPSTSYDSNGAGWTTFESWKNTIHETNLVDGFTSFPYILESMINEMTGPAHARGAKAVAQPDYFCRPNAK